MWCCCCLPPGLLHTQGQLSLVYKDMSPLREYQIFFGKVFLYRHNWFKTIDVSSIYSKTDQPRVFQNDYCHLDTKSYLLFMSFMADIFFYCYFPKRWKFPVFSFQTVKGIQPECFCSSVTHHQIETSYRAVILIAFPFHCRALSAKASILYNDEIKIQIEKKM